VPKLSTCEQKVACSNPDYVFLFTRVFFTEVLELCAESHDRQLALRLRPRLIGNQGDEDDLSTLIFSDLN